MTADELRAAAARLRNPSSPVGLTPDELWNRTQRWANDARVVVAAWLRDNPEDDGEPVTGEFLESLGFELSQDKPHGRRWKLVVCRQDHGSNQGVTTHWLDVHEPCDDGSGRLWWPINFWQRNEDDRKADGVGLLSWVEHTTRGHVRRLLAALGVALAGES
jgi:hypothetical protein